ncbi:hypothetical protein [Halioxenophilus aromaticivorans]|uniref:Lipoprotein n=1 Tax=Halioxenophilus aromaticivorans TaxID=1306992 RepID=A0AAV3U5V0_9ALTE
MQQTKIFIAMLAAAAVLTGCGGGDDGDDVTINIEQTTDDTGSGSDGGDSGSGGTGVLPDGAPDASKAFVTYNSDYSVGTLEGIIDEDVTLVSSIEWRLAGVVQVGEGNVAVTTDADVQAIKDAGVTLTVEPGTNIRSFDDGTLLVTRGSMLMADGTAAEPITFSSVADADFDGLGEWGGVIIQGFATQYGQGGTGACYGTGTVCNVEGEGGTDVSVFGGNEDDDNSGIIRYVRIAEGGRIAGPNNEINGLTLQGVGHGTTIEYVQVHQNLDDGIEWFGGTVNAKYVVLTGNDDDDIDFDEGFKGNIQYALIEKDPNASGPQGSNDPRGIEANSSDADYTPETDAVIANVTIIGSEVNKAANSSGDDGQPGMRLRGSLITGVYNSAVANFTDCVRIDDSDTDGDGTVDSFSNVTLENVIGDCDDAFYARRAADVETNTDINTTLSFTATRAIAEPVAQLDSVTSITAVDNGSGFVFDPTNYIGAVDPAAASGWWEGWTIPGSVNAVEPAEASFVTCADDVCTVTGRIDEDYTFVAGYEWRLSGEVIVGEGNVSVATDADVQAVKDNGVTLTIQPGVHVRAFDDGSLLVTRGSKLEAAGTPSSPITFSSAADDDLEGLGEWGGVIVQGFAPQYGQGGTGACYGSGNVCNVEGEGGTVVGNFGGNDPADDSGTIRYVRIAEGGKIAGPNNEINGLTLQGVGYGTTVEYVQVHQNLDDGIEWFGGTVNAKYLVLTGNDDDDIDFDEGYKGNIQYAIIRKDQTATAPQGSNDPRAIEANSSDQDYTPETEGALANILIIGSDMNKAGGEPAMRLRGALTSRVYNTAITAFTDCVRIDDADTDGAGTMALSDVTLDNVIGQCDEDFYSHEEPDATAGIVQANSVTVDGAYALTDAEAVVTAPTFVPVDNGSGFTFDSTGFIGAVEPGTAAADAWWAGWIIEGSLD